MFMLDDFVLKLRHVLCAKRPAGFGKSSDNVGFDNLSVIPINDIVKTVSKLSSHFARFLQEIVEYSHVINHLFNFLYHRIICLYSFNV